MTRLQTLRQTDAQPDMPDAGAAQYLLGYLFDAGPFVNVAGGSAPLNWQDLRAWQSGTGIELQPWEARALRGLSQIYLRASVEAQAPDCPAPYTEQPTPDQREHVASALRSIFGNLKKAA